MTTHVRLFNINTQGGKNGPDQALKTNKGKPGIDTPEEAQEALVVFGDADSSNFVLVTSDDQHSKYNNIWSKDQLVKLAGPLFSPAAPTQKNKTPAEILAPLLESAKSQKMSVAWLTVDRTLEYIEKNDSLSEDLFKRQLADWKEAIPSDAKLKSAYDTYLKALRELIPLLPDGDQKKTLSRIVEDESPTVPTQSPATPPASTQLPVPPPAPPSATAPVQQSPAEKQKLAAQKMKEANVLFNAGKYEEAISLYREADDLGTEPDFKLKTKFRVVECYQKLSVAPSRSATEREGFTILAGKACETFLNESPDPKKYAAQIKTTDTIKKDAARVHFKNGNAALEKADYEAALLSFQSAERTVPGAFPKYKIAECLDKLNRKQEAVAAYNVFLGAVDFNDKDEREKHKERIATAFERRAALEHRPSPLPPLVILTGDKQAAEAFIDLEFQDFLGKKGIPFDTAPKVPNFMGGEGISFTTEPINKGRTIGSGNTDQERIENAARAVQTAASRFSKIVLSSKSTLNFSIQVVLDPVTGSIVKIKPIITNGQKIEMTGGVKELDSTHLNKLIYLIVNELHDSGRFTPEYVRNNSTFDTGIQMGAKRIEPDFGGQDL